MTVVLFLFGIASTGKNVIGKIVGTLRKMGVKYVFDTTYGADLTIFEEANELISRLKNNNIKGKRVLLIDDVFTTGSTLRECAKVLKKAGAVSVDALTVAKVC